MPEESGFNFNPRVVVILVLAFPPAAAFFEWSIHPLWYVLISVGGGYILFDKFIEKSKVRRVRPQQVGVLHPLVTPDSQIWTSKYNEDVGEMMPVKEYVPPKARFKG